MNTQGNVIPANCCVDNDSSGTGARAGSSIVKNLLIKVMNYFTERRRQRMDRLTLDELSTLDDANLRDIGLSRDDVHWARTLPLSADATTELEILVRRASRKR